MKTHLKMIACALLITIMLTNVQCTISKTQKIKSGKIYFAIKQTPSSSSELFQFSYDSSIKSEIKLTQSSKIDVQAKIKFTSESFRPQLISFRLRHQKYDRLTEPVQLVYSDQSQSFKGVIDFGDPNTIKPYSDSYKLELIIADEALQQNIRSTVGTFRINFRYSLAQSQVPDNNWSIAYKVQSTIQNPPPQARIDPPQTFTTFILILMTVFSAIFCYGLASHLQVNFKQLPTSGLGLLSNLLLIGLITANFVFLIKFWLTWNFITTVTNFFWLLIVTALVANTALQYVKNTDKIAEQQQ